MAGRILKRIASETLWRFPRIGIDKIQERLAYHLGPGYPHARLILVIEHGLKIARDADGPRLCLLGMFLVIHGERLCLRRYK